MQKESCQKMPCGLYKSTLGLVNKILVKNGKKPVKRLSAGKSQRNTLCPISQTLKDGGIKRQVRTGCRSIGIGGDRLTLTFTQEEIVGRFTDIIDERKPGEMVDPLLIVKGGR